MRANRWTPPPCTGSSVRWIPGRMRRPGSSTSVAEPGGERQRVSVARAVLKRAPVLLVDEGTSSLDASAAVAVQEAIRELAGSATVLVIAHQEHTVAAADQVVMLDGGRVAAAGIHEDLLASSQAYARLWAR